MRISCEVRSNVGFYIGDICYVLDDDLYDNVWVKQNNCREGCITDPKSGISFAVAGTAEGDGEYYDRAGHSYLVDAGVIGVVPLELVAKPDEDLGHVIRGAGTAQFAAEDGVFDIVVKNNSGKDHTTVNRRVVIDTSSSFGWLCW